jgi:hypothetical protein
MNAMRLRTSLFSLACLLAATAAALADAPRPNFTGTWELDQSKSHSVPPDMKQTMTVVHDGDKVSVETKVVGAQGERVIKDSFTLDGKEAEFTPQSGNPNAPPSRGKRTGAWLPNGKGFFLEETVQTKNPQGEDVTLYVSRKWTQWPDGTISIETIQETPRGTFNNKRVFVKKA